jgi:molecular chaperone GrpE
VLGRCLQAIGLSGSRDSFDKLKEVDTENSQEKAQEVQAEDPLTAERDRLSAEKDRLLAEKAELEDRLLRARAEFQNARMRSERERSDYLQFAATDLVKELLPVLDDFERAMRVETADREYAKGVELIYQRLFDTLKKMGLEPLDVSGRRFDPNLHQAIERVQTEDAEDQSILGEFQRGYQFKGRLLRPAMVKVAVKP